MWNDFDQSAAGGWTTATVGLFLLFESYMTFGNQWPPISGNGSCRAITRRNGAESWSNPIDISRILSSYFSSQSRLTVGATCVRHQKMA